MTSGPFPQTPGLPWSSSFWNCDACSCCCVFPYYSINRVQRYTKSCKLPPGPSGSVPWPWSLPWPGTPGRDCKKSASCSTLAAIAATLWAEKAVFPAAIAKNRPQKHIQVQSRQIPRTKPERNACLEARTGWSRCRLCRRGGDGPDRRERPRSSAGPGGTPGQARNRPASPWHPLPALRWCCR